ncbi:MAG: hypothetical protein ACOCT0_01805 [Halobacteriota archaeon]
MDLGLAATGDLGLDLALTESHYTLFAVALLTGLMAFHLAFVFGRTRSKAGPAEAASDGMVVCPECERATEAEYRYCRYCVSEVGGAGAGGPAAGGSERSGMF